MNPLKKLFKQTFVYGLATVFPRVLNVFLVRLHTEENVLDGTAEYGRVSLIFSAFVILNVLLSYGMETSFFRFYNKEEDKHKVIGTSTISVLLSTLFFLVITLVFKTEIAALVHFDESIIELVIWILALDALAIIPFALLRAKGKAMKYSVIKIINVLVNVAFSLVFLLWLKGWSSSMAFLDAIYIKDYQINYIFIANLIASSVTLLLLASFYFNVKYSFSKILWKKMMKYSFPVLIAGMAFSVNEVFDRFLIKSLLPEAIAESEVGIYSACYKLGLFMMLFATGYRLGVEPFFFSHADKKDAKNTYAKILEFFVIFGSLILLGVVVYADILKQLFVKNPAYWEAMWVVPIILMANFCLGIYHNLSVWYKITDRTKFGAYISVMGAIITLVLLYILIPIISYKGAALATLAAYSTMMVVSYCYGRKYYPIPYNLKRIGLYLGTSVVFSLTSFYVFERNLYIGTALLLVFIAIIIIFEKQKLQQIFIKK